MHRPLILRVTVALVASFAASALFAQDNWTLVASSTAQNLWSVTWGANNFVAVGEVGTIVTSSDGITWTPRISGNAGWLVGVGYGNGLFVVVGEQGTILTSPDGIAWTGRTSGTTARINGVAFGGGRWLAVAESGEVLSSSDAITWTKLAPSADRLRGLTYAYGQFVITGDNGLMRTTIDTVDYDANVLPEGLFVESVAYARRMFLAVGEDGYAIRSDDAVTWNRVATGTTAYLRGVTFFNGVFIAAGSSGTILTAVDPARAWTPRATGTSALFTAASASDGAVVAVGFDGTIIRSAPASAAPSISNSPASSVAMAGDNVLFRVSATGSLPLSYQWSFNGQPLAGQTSEQLLVNGVQAVLAGVYSVTVTNSRGSATSAPATLAIVVSTEPSPIVDSTFDATGLLSSAPNAAAEQADGKIIICNSGARLLARLNVDGSRDHSFNVGTGVSGSVNQLHRQSDDGILVSGGFTAIDGLARAGFARLHSDGSVDSLFVPPSVVARPPSAFENDPHLGIALQPDGKILVITLADSRLYRLNANGSLDSTFANGLNATLVASLRNGQLVAGTGAALSLLNSNGVPVRDIATAPSSGSFRRLLPSPDGGILVEQVISIRLALGVSDVTYVLFRLGADGQRDVSWPGISIRGGFSLTARHAVTSDGKIIRASSESTKHVIQRFNSDASIDFTFDPRRGPDNGISGILPLRDGRTLAVGAFRTFDGVSRAFLVRLVSANAPPRQSPVIVSITPEAAAVRPGEQLVLSVVAAGSGPLTYRWSDVIPAGERAKATVNVPTVLSGSYTISVSVTNSAGTIVSPPIRVVIAPSAPIITKQPVPVVASIARSATFTVEAAGSAPFTYQWFRNGMLVGASSSLTLTEVSQRDSGDYFVVVRNSLGVSTSSVARLTVDGASHLTNISTRATVGPDDRALIAGFVIRGTEPKTILIRGISPGLAAFGLSGLLPNPVLTLRDSLNQIVATNDNWDPNATPPALFQSVGAFGLSGASADAALRITLAPGSYTTALADTAGRTGIAVVEIYEADRNNSRLANLSSRAFVDQGASLVIAGIVVQGQQPGRFLIRAIGPTLTQLSITGALADPLLTLTTATSIVVATNDNWSTNTNAADIASVSAQIGAFPLASGARDAALLVTLAPGNYTALVAGANNTTGVALVEVYEVP
jgi:uncharacterized delta-60 repeat protein